MEYVVFETGGKQYKAAPGQIVSVDHIGGDKALSFDKVLLHVKDGEVNIGKPYLTGIVVDAKLVEEKRGPKTRVSRFTAKSRHRRVIGHRSLISMVQIEKVSKQASSDVKPTVKTSKK